MLQISPLGQRVKEYREALRDAAVGPTRAAYILVDVLDNWNLYEAHAGTPDGVAWCSKAFANKSAATKARNLVAAAEVVVAHGYSRSYATSRIDSAVLVFVTGRTMSDADQKVMLQHLFAEQSRRGNLLNLVQARALARRLLGRTGAKERPSEAGALFKIAVAHIQALRRSHPKKSLPPLPAELASFVDN